MNGLWLLLVAASAVDMDQTVKTKLHKVQDITEQINNASKEVMVLQDKNWVLGSPETEKATKQLKELLERAEGTNMKLQMGMATVKGKATQAQMLLDQATAQSSKACGATPCDLAASEAADVRIDEFKESLQDFETVSNWKIQSVYDGDLDELQEMKERKRKFLHDLFTKINDEKQICEKQLGHKQTHLTPCQSALNQTIHAQWFQVASQQLVDSCTTSAEKLSVSIKRAEELLRPLTLGEQRLFQQRMSPETRWPWMAKHGVELLGLSLVAMFASLSLVAMMVRSRLRNQTRVLMDEELLLQ